MDEQPCLIRRRIRRARLAVAEREQFPEVTDLSALHIGVNKLVQVGRRQKSHCRLHVIDRHAIAILFR